MKNLILGCGITRCGSGYLSFFMFLNNKISDFNGPEMREIQGLSVADPLPLSALYDIWGDEFHEPTHGKVNHMKDWYGLKGFMPYYKKRLKTRSAKSDAIFVSHAMGERFYPIYRDVFDCEPIAICCSREIVGHFRSFKRWYQGFSAEDFFGRLRGSLDDIDAMKADGCEVICINTPDSSVKENERMMKDVMKRIGIPISKEQLSFLKKRRQVGRSLDFKVTDDSLLKELRSVPDFEQLNARYSELMKTSK